MTKSLFHPIEDMIDSFDWFRVIDGSDIEEESSWEFYFPNRLQYIEIKNSDMDTPDKLRELYSNFCHVPAPRFTIAAWDEFRNIIYERADVVKMVEDTETKGCAVALLTKIREIEGTVNVEEATNRVVIAGNNHSYISEEMIQFLIDDNSLGKNVNTMRKTLEYMGYVCGTSLLEIGDVKLKMWQLNSYKCFLENPNEIYKNMVKEHGAEINS
jgi:hypothetical protein